MEKVKFNRRDDDLVNITMGTDEVLNKHGFIGEVTDKIIYPDGRIEVIESHNIVVNSISRLIAAFVKGEPGYMNGNLYWAFGTGKEEWDSNPYTPVASASTLVNEVFRKPITDRAFIDSNNNPVDHVTNRLELKVILGSDEANGHSLREFGVFGGNATGTKNSGIMLNHKVHARIDKVEGMQIERRVRFTF